MSQGYCLHEFSIRLITDFLKKLHITNYPSKDKFIAYAEREDSTLINPSSMS